MQGRHTKLARALHWGFIGLYAYGVAKQLDDVSQLEDAALLQFEMVFAALFLAVVVTRYVYMQRFDTFAAATTPISAARRRWARIFHRVMYLCFALLPVSGLFIGGLYAGGVEDGWMQDAAVGLHEFCADSSYVLIGLHVAAAVASRWKREGVWSSMVPLFQEHSGPG